MTRPFLRGTSAGAFPFPPYSDSFFRLSERLYYSIFQTADCQALQIHVQLHPYPCLCLFLKETSMGIPPRVAMTLGLGPISRIRQFRTFQCLNFQRYSVFTLSITRYRPSLTSSRRTSYSAWSLQNPLYLSLESPSKAPSGVAQ